MWITSEVELPQAVLDAQASGRLVFFVGAGASVPPPSGLPLFRGLAEQLANLARVPFDDSVAIDFFLGSLPPTFDVHTHARNLIQRPGSTFSPAHTALVSIASSVPPLRIVTTNFDQHLSSAATVDGVHVADTWIGPALPLGDDFEGLVHLHGSVDRPARELVLTDSDFGRAYLTYAWATRFLVPMFQHFTVVFVGYSHDDPIMRYLALGLPSRTPRFVFTEKSVVEDPKWARLGVEAIPYPVVDGDHSALVAALEAWAVRSRMGQLEHAAQIHSIVGAGPLMTPVDRDYLLGRLGTEDGAREFAAASQTLTLALQVAWLIWLEGHDEFKSLFVRSSRSTGADRLGSWFCRTFVMSPELNGAALQTIQRLGSSFGRGLFDQLCWATEELGKHDIDAARRWQAFLATSVTGQSASLHADLLLPYFAADTVEHNAILRAAMKPQLTLKRRWFTDDADHPTTIPDAEVTWNIDEHHLTAHLNKLIELSASGDPIVGSMLGDALLAAYDLNDAYHSGGREWDALSYGRSAIEPHEQDSFRTPLDAIIDGLRVFGERALPLTSDLITRWWGLERPLFRRLALHLLCGDESRSADDKLNWILDHDTIYAHRLKHEVFRALAATLTFTSTHTRARLLTAVLRGPDYPEDVEDRDRHIAYSKFNLLVWLTTTMPKWKEAQKAQRSLLRSNPTFMPRAHPDFDMWSTVGDVESTAPMEADDFLASWSKDPSGTLDGLLNRDYSERSWDGPTWRDALGVAGRVSERQPQVGDEFWSLLEQRGDIDDAIATDLRIAIIEGWAKADIQAVDHAVDRVGTMTGQPSAARPVSRFLLEQARRQIDGGDTAALHAMRDVAQRLWAEQSNGFTHAEGVDPVSMAPLYLNSWPGELAQYWLAEVDHRWRNHRDNWMGLDDEETAALNRLLTGSDDARDATLPALAGEVFFLFAADPEFTANRVIPLFQRDETARLAWNPFLLHPRYNDRLLAAGMLQATIAQWSRLDEIRDHSLRFSFYGLVVSIVSLAAISPVERQILLDQTVLADEGTRAAEFADATARFLREDTINGSEVWVEWLRQHLLNRINGLPRIPRSEELESWADTVPYLGEHIPEAIDLLSGHGIGLGSRFMNPVFRDDVLTAHGPAWVHYYAERIGNSYPNDDYSMAYRVAQLIDALQTVLGEEAVQPAVLAARDQGFTRAE